MASPHSALNKARLATLYLAALSVSLPMAWISLGKLGLMLATLLVLAMEGQSRRAQATALGKLWTVRLALASILAFALSLAWTEVDTRFALGMLVKHAKLIQVVLILFLIRSREEASKVVLIFVVGQVFVLISSWLLATGTSLPWVRNEQWDRKTRFVVFSESYLDQSVMMAALAAVLWHLRASWKWPLAATVVLALAAVLNPVALMDGRTGHVAVFAVVMLAIFWSLPKKWRIAGMVIAPVALAIGLMLGADRVSSRFAEIARDSQTYSKTGDTASSSGWRLNAWHRSVQAIAEKPWLGHGVGSWTPAIKRLDGENATRNFGAGNSSNPHQEFLLWGVELGVGGMVLLLAFFGAMVRDSAGFAAPQQRALRSCLAVAVIACLFNSSLYDALVGDYLCTVLALLLALGVHTPSPPDAPQSLPQAPAA